MRTFLATLLLGAAVWAHAHAPLSQATPKAKAVQGPLPNPPFRVLPGHRERVTSVAVSPDGKWIATAAWDGTARIWDAATCNSVRRLGVPANKPFDPARLTRIVFSPDAKWIAAAAAEEITIVWNRHTGEKVFQFPAASIAFAPDGQTIAGGERDENGGGVVRLRELGEGNVVRAMRGHQTVIESLEFSPDRKTLLSTGRLPRGLGTGRIAETQTGYTRVWDVATGRERRTRLETLKDSHLALAPDGRTVAGAYGSSVILREIATGRPRAELGHVEDVCEMAFAPDGRTLATASMDKTVKLWDLPSCKEIGRLEGHTNWVLTVAFSPDGATLVTGGTDHAALVWDVSKITRRRSQSSERSPAELEADWKDLGRDAATAYAAMGRLVASPGRGVPFLGKQLQATKPVDVKRIDRLIGNLENERFQVREQAMKELAALADIAEPQLRKALEGKPTLEVSRRLNTLLERLDLASSLLERPLRAVETLELIGNAEARRLLEQLAAEPAQPGLAVEARTSAARLARRSMAAP